MRDKLREYRTSIISRGDYKTPGQLGPRFLSLDSISRFLSIGADRRKMKWGIEKSPRNQISALLVLCLLASKFPASGRDNRIGRELREPVETWIKFFESDGRSNGVARWTGRAAASGSVGPFVARFDAAVFTLVSSRPWGEERCSCFGERINFSRLSAVADHRRTRKKKYAERVPTAISSRVPIAFLQVAGIFHPWRGVLGHFRFFM